MPTTPAAGSAWLFLNRDELVAPGADRAFVEWGAAAAWQPRPGMMA